MEATGTEECVNVSNEEMVEAVSGDPCAGQAQPPLDDKPPLRVGRDHSYWKASRRTLIVASLGAVAGGALVLAVAFSFNKLGSSSQAAGTDLTAIQPAEASSPAIDSNLVRIEDKQMQNIKLETAAEHAFRVEKIATGKIAFNDDFLTPVFSPYTGRVLRLIAKPGDVVKQGSPLLEIDSPDLVQVESDLIAASISVARSNTVLDMARRGEDRQHRLYLNKAVSLKDWEQAEADLKNAERDVRSAESSLAAARARLRSFGKSDEEIVKIEGTHQIDRVTRIPSPIAGTITARRVGPGQYIKPDNPDSLFTIADLSTAWILADVYESDVPLLKVGQPVEVRVTAYPNEVFTAHISYISPAIDPTTHRAAVRSVVQNRGQKLKPDMLASFRIVTSSEIHALAVPQKAIIRQGDKASIWIAQEGNRFRRMDVRSGNEQGGYVQILSGLQPGNRVVSEGAVYLSNAANSQE